MKPKPKGLFSKLSFDTILSTLHRIKSQNLNREALEHSLDILSGPLKPSDVSQVLNHLADAETAMWFFRWCAKRHGYSHDICAHNTLLGVLGSSRKFDAAWKIVDEMHGNGCGMDDSTFTTLIRSYGKAGMAARAMEVVKGMRKYGYDSSVMVYTCLMHVLMRGGMVEMAEYVYELMVKEDGLCPNKYVFSVLLYGYGKAGKMARVYEVYSEMVASGCEEDKVTKNSLIDGLCKGGMVNEALQMFREVWQGRRTLEAYNMLLRGLCSDGRMKEAIELMKEMMMVEQKQQKKKELLNPDVVSYNTVIHGFVRARQMGDALLLFQEMQRADVLPDRCTYNALIHGLCQSSRLDDAVALFNQMLRAGCSRDTFSYTVLIHGLCRSGKALLAHRYFAEMQSKGFPADTVLYTVLLQSLLIDLRDLKSACKLFTAMVKANCQPDVFTYSILIHGLCQTLKVEMAETIFRAMLERGLTPHSATFHSLIDGYCKSNRLAKAYAIFQELIISGIHMTTELYNTFVSCFCKAGYLGEAENLVKSMESQGFCPNVATFTSLISCMCKVGRIYDAYGLFKEMPRLSVTPDSIIFNVLILGFLKSGRDGEANMLLGKMKESGFSTDPQLVGMVESRYYKSGKLKKKI
jgi:leucine-rich PPR motif-containing protein